MVLLLSCDVDNRREDVIVKARWQRDDVLYGIYRNTFSATSSKTAACLSERSEGRYEERGNDVRSIVKIELRSMKQRNQALNKSY